MKTASVGEIQKNFSKVLNSIKNGEEITVTKRGEPVARIVSLGPKDVIDWPDFQAEAVELQGEKLSDIVIESRDDRF